MKRAVLPAGRVIAHVEPLTSTRAVRGPFDYLIGAGRQPVEVGSIVRVPFGGSRTLGVVVGLAGESELASDRLAEPDAVIEPGVPSDLVALAQWIAAEYCSTPARALGLVLPPGTARGARGRNVLVAAITDAGRLALLDGGELTSKQRAALDRLERGGAARAAELGSPFVRRLERRGLVELETRVETRRPARVAVGAAPPSAPPLTAEQQSALDRVLAALADGSGPPERRLLLHGVTGSGKTEIYLGAVEAALAAGRTAIVLVPEIALTPQTVSRFEARFGDVVAVLHSSLGAGERRDEWRRLRDGAARVCVGARSAVFAPLDDVGLIIVDEEHDSSYKHEGDPRYDARTVALRRAEHHRAVLLAGTATPRPESFASLARVRLRNRIDRRPLPPVEVLDMRAAHHPLHPVTRLALADVRRAGAKAIVLLNRRGWSNFLSCRECGRVWMCRNCEVTLVLHRGRPGESLLACHHCGHRERVPDRCGACASVALARHGAGTERIEHDLREALGQQSFPVFRLDAGSGGGRDRVAQTLARFDRAPAGVLVGTQIVAKGHDFPAVTLGVVVDADQTLRFPDFRAEERTFALIAQLAGRAGRGEGGGRVLVQTLAPSSRAIEHAARHDSDGFLADELGRREALGYPPFRTLIRVVCAAADVVAARSLAAALYERIAVEGATVLGPAPLFRVRGRARSQLVVKAADRAGAIAAVGAAVNELAALASQRRVGISVDVDPQ